MNLFGPRRSSPADIEELVRDVRRAATYPSTYESGWYLVAHASDLDREAKQDRPLGVELLGERLVLFRDQSGKLNALDAYCPHLGADLSGGKVCAGQLECPFHRWQFGGDGEVRSIPYLSQGRRLPTVSAQTRVVREQDGVVFVWHGEEPPHYEVPPIDAGLLHRGDHDAGVVKMHLQEFAENSVDFQHFAPLHGQMRLPWIGLPIPGLTIHHSARWETIDDKPWTALFHDDAMLRFMGRDLPWSAAKATITFHGPGSVVYFRFQIPKYGDIVLMQAHTPLAPTALRVRFRWFADPAIPRLLVSYVVGNWVAQWREDISIWENKVFRKRPQLVRDDGPVHALRRWYEQFRA